MNNRKHRPETAFAAPPTSDDLTYVERRRIEGQPLASDNLIQAIADAVSSKLNGSHRTAPLVLAPEYLTPKQASDLSGISMKTLEKYRQTFKLKGFGAPFVKIGRAGRPGGRIRYPAADFRKWLETFRQS